LSGFKVELENTGLSAVSDSNGYFEITNVPGGKTYTLVISKEGYLARKISPVIVNGNRIIFSKNAPIDIIAGDIPVDGVQDNAINMNDVLQIAKAFGYNSSEDGYVPYVDFNKDNSINIMDAMLLAKNFNATQADYPTFVLGDYDLDGTPYTMNDFMAFFRDTENGVTEFNEQFKILSADSNGDGILDLSDFIRPNYSF